ncbi:UNVERIFIED_CONTAM: hypothetical protein GTU68_044347, partial [Idotea baltica]|nr:hypothetical protein [Idotea baltica]
MSNFEFDTVEDEFDFSDGGGQWAGRNATIFLIDASPKMFENTGDEEDSYFVKSLRCAHSTVSRKIIGNDQDFYSIIIFNTTQMKNSLDFAHVYVFQDIDRPGAERMLELESLIEDSSVKNASKSFRFGSTDTANIHDVLWICRSIFLKCKKNLLTKTVLVFTGEDNPHAGDDHKQRQALKGAKDMHEGGVEIEILPLGDQFDPHKFYEELLSQANEEGGSLSVLANPTDRFEELLERVHRLEHKQ